MVDTSGLLALVLLAGKPALAFLLPRHAVVLLAGDATTLISETARIVPGRCRLRRLCYRFVALLMDR
jgi:hypothetical protein